MVFVLRNREMAIWICSSTWRWARHGDGLDMAMLGTTSRRTSVSRQISPSVLDSTTTSLSPFQPQQTPRMQLALHAANVEAGYVGCIRWTIVASRIAGPRSRGALTRRLVM